MMFQVIFLHSVLAVCAYPYSSVLLKSVVKKPVSNSDAVRKTDLGDLVRSF